MTTKTTRRTLLAGAAALPVLTVPAFAATSIKDDPTFAAIDHARKCEEEFLALARREDAAEGAGIKLDKAPDDHRTPEMVAAVKEAIAARIALASTVPTTPTGLAALTTFVREKNAELGEFYFAADDTDEQFLFVASLDAAVRGMAGLKPWGGIADAQAVDPIFAAIERQKQLWAEWDHATHPEPPLRSAGYPAWEEWNDAAADAYYGALEALVAIKPTTRAGAAALIAHCIAEDSSRFPSVEEAGLANALLQTLAKAMPTLA
jgi:hypothetical protein